MRRKTFKDNESYFKFYNSAKDKIQVLCVKIGNKIVLNYEILNEKTK